MKNFLSRSLVIKIILWFGLLFSFGSGAPSIFSQQVPTQIPDNCYRPKSDKERHECLIILQNENLKRVEARQPKNKPPHESIQKIEADRLALEERRNQELELIRERVEKSRARNISNKGKKYRVTFGRVAEPTD